MMLIDSSFSSEDVIQRLCVVRCSDNTCCHTSHYTVTVHIIIVLTNHLVCNICICTCLYVPDMALSTFENTEVTYSAKFRWG